MTVRENGVAPDFPTLNAAIAAWVAAGRPNTVITIEDNRTSVYPVPKGVDNPTGGTVSWRDGDLCHALDI